jgi:hypothetical protein
MTGTLHPLQPDLVDRIDLAQSLGDKSTNVRTRAEKYHPSAKSA